MAEKMEILVEKQRRGARSNQKLKILYLAKFFWTIQMLIMILHYRRL